MNFKFNQGEQNVMPYTPTVDVKAGDFVDLHAGANAGIKGGVATNDIKANEEGVLDIGPKSFYWGKVDAVVGVGTPLFSDGSDTLTSAGVLFGYAAEASTAIGQTIRVQLDTKITPLAA